MKFGNRIYYKLLIAIILPMIVLFSSFVTFLNIMIAPYLEGLILNKIEMVAQRRAVCMESVYKQLYQSSQSIISDNIVQSTLTVGFADEQERLHIKDLLRTYCYDNVFNITYLTKDCNQMISGLVDSRFSKSYLEKLTLNPELNKTYSKPVWIYAQGKNKSQPLLFVVQKLRHLAFNIEPGYLIYQLKPNCMDQITQMLTYDSEIVALTDQNGQIVCHSPSDDSVDKILKSFEFSDAQYPQLGTVISHQGYMVSNFVSRETGWRIISYIDRAHAMQRYNSLQQLMINITIVLVIVCIGIGMLLTRYYIRPINTIVQAMESFQNSRFQRRISTKLPDEFGKIGETFNLMADKIETLIENVKQEKENLRNAELNSLMYQINPHFIYNTLNNIYMLARMSGQTQMALIIDSLSKFLRNTLSKGSSTVLLKDEIEHVSSYLNIQKIRYEDLFDFSVQVSPDLSLVPVLKFILQPITENSINHGFMGMESGGYIHISAFEHCDRLYLTVEDNGQGMSEETLERLNHISDLSVEQLSLLFPESKGGYGVGNVIARLRIYYQDNYQIYFENLFKGVKCTIILPKRM